MGARAQRKSKTSSTVTIGSVRERLFSVLSLNNRRFPAGPGELLRLSQKLLEPLIFAFFWRIWASGCFFRRS